MGLRELQVLVAESWEGTQPTSSRSGRRARAAALPMYSTAAFDEDMKARKQIQKQKRVYKKKKKVYHRRKSEPTRIKDPKTKIFFEKEIFKKIIKKANQGVVAVM